MEISINTHSSIKIVSDSLIIYVDPFKISEAKNDATHILITHDHYDHFSKEDIEKVRNDNTIIITPTCLNGDIKLKPFEKYDFIETVSSYNVNKNFHPKEKEYLGFILNLEGKRIYIVGDSDNCFDVKCDILLIPIGGTYTFDYFDASKYVNMIKPKEVIPTHYGDIVGSLDLGEKFSKLIDKDIKCTVLLK